MLYVFLFALLCFLCACIGASIVFFVKKGSNKMEAFLHAFASGVMIASSIFSLIIPAIRYAKELSLNIAIILPICFVIVGVLFLLLDFAAKNKSKNQVNIPMIMLGVGLHNIPEGICIGVAFASWVTIGSYASFMSAIMIAVGIAIQNIPEGSSISFPLYCKGMSKFKSFLCSAGVASIEVVSCIIAFFVGSNNVVILPFMLSFAGAVMLVVAICDLMPEASQRHKIWAFVSFILGFVLMMTLSLALG